MDVAYERPASSSSYFTRPSPPSRLLLRVYSAECLRHVSSHGTYCKIYVGSTDMVRGSGAFARRSQKLTSSGSRGNRAQPPTTPLPPTSSSEGDLSGSSSKMRVLKTQVQKGKRPDPVWNEKFDIPVLDPNDDVLSIRVKSARLMSSPAIGAIYDHRPMVDLKLGKKDAGRIRLQLRLVDPSRQRNHQNSDTHLSLPTEETPEQIAARNKTLRRDHKYHRSARHFDGRPVTSSQQSASDKDDDQKKRVPTTPTTLRDNSASATSNESIDDSEPASDRASKEDDPESTSAVPREPRESFDSFAETPQTLMPSPPVAAGAKGLDASYAHRGTMRRSELERSKMKMAEISRTSRISRSSRSSKSQVSLEDDDYDDDDLDEYDNSSAATKRWTGNHTKLSVLSSLDPRESSRMDFDDEIEYERDTLDKRKASVNNGSSSIALSSTATSTLDPRESSRFSFSDSDSEDEKMTSLKSEKEREQQRQQWQMEQRNMQLVRIKEVSQSMSDDESDEDDSEDDDEYDEEMEQERESTRIQFTPALANLLGRESMNVLFEDEDEEEEEESPEPYKMSEEFVPFSKRPLPCLSIPWTARCAGQVLIEASLNLIY
ncbi:C2 domain [Phytophthora cactorum]|nr:C2 domain [Phytophthora cactorum]